MKRLVLAPLALAAIATIIACGSTAGSEYDEDGLHQDSGNGGNDKSETGPGPIGVVGDEDSGIASDASDFGDAKCAAESVVAERAPAYLYFVLDQSGSMGDGEHGDPTQKWDPVTTALKGFLVDPKTKGISAALELFPKGAEDKKCNSSTYGVNLVAGLTALPDTAKAFSSKIPAQALKGGTPMLAALQGVLLKAKANADAKTDGKTVVVLITDGEPASCTDDSVTSVQTEVAKYKTTVPTHVIGVGKSLTKLNDIASSGGTTKAILLNVGTPSQTQTEFAKAIDDIRVSALACDVAIPAPPAGKTLDLAKVNVSLSKSGTSTPLAYDAACKAGGWKFDSTSAPKSIVLCPTLCDSVKNEPDSNVSVEFGCARRETTIN